jgi:hypothetical protein
MDSDIWSNIPIDIYHIIRGFSSPRIIEVVLNIFKKIYIRLRCLTPIEPAVSIYDGKLPRCRKLNYESEQIIYKTKNMRLTFDATYNKIFIIQFNVIIKDGKIINIEHECLIPFYQNPEYIHSIMPLSKWIDKAKEYNMLSILKRNT